MYWIGTGQMKFSMNIFWKYLASSLKIYNSFALEWGGVTPPIPCLWLKISKNVSFCFWIYMDFYTQSDYSERCLFHLNASKVEYPYKNFTFRWLFYLDPVPVVKWLCISCHLDLFIHKNTFDTRKNTALAKIFAS